MVRHIHFPTISSTHKWARAHRDQCLENFITLITADYQTEGVGRKNEPWIAPRGKCLLATYFITRKPEKHAENLAQLIAYSMLKVLQQREIHLNFKWPNDLIFHEQKVAGVCCDIVESGIILSIGMNVLMTEEELKEIPSPATSLLEITKEKLSIKELTKELTIELEQDLEELFLKGFTSIAEELTRDLAYIHKPVLIDGRKAIIKKLHTDGRLLVETEEGNELLVTGSLSPIVT